MLFLEVHIFIFLEIFIRIKRYCGLRRSSPHYRGTSMREYKTSSRVIFNNEDSDTHILLVYNFNALI